MGRSGAVRCFDTAGHRIGVLLEFAQCEQQRIRQAAAYAGSQQLQGRRPRACAKRRRLIDVEWRNVAAERHGKAVVLLLLQFDTHDVFAFGLLSGSRTTGFEARGWGSGVLRAAAGSGIHGISPFSNSAAHEMGRASTATLVMHTGYSIRSHSRRDRQQFTHVGPAAAPRWRKAS